MNAILYKGNQFKVINMMSNSVDPDKTDRYEPAHQDLHCIVIFVLFYRVEWLRITGIPEVKFSHFFNQLNNSIFLL